MQQAVAHDTLRPSPFELAAAQPAVGHLQPEKARQGCLAALWPGRRSVLQKDVEESDKPHWTSLPDHLLEIVLDLLLEDGKDDNGARKDMFAAVGVCKLWRRVGFHHFFLRTWQAAADVIHPLQLLSLSARAVPGNLLRCFVRREEMPRRGFGCARYCMYLDGEGPGHSPRKFLLAAMQTHRREVLVFLDRQCEGQPIARLACSLLQMKYRISTTPGCALPFVETLTRPDSLARRTSLPGRLLPRLGSGRQPSDTAVQLARLPPVLAQVQYHMRLKGFMRPRRMQVTLPHPMELAAFDPQPQKAEERLAPVCSTCPLVLPAAAAASPGRSMRMLRRSASGPSQANSVPVPRIPGAAVMAAAHSAPVNEALDAAADAALAAAGLLPGSQVPVPPQLQSQPQQQQQQDPLPLGLRNKQPHWNDNLRCHCLNFSGRVKEASVKNFQLVCSDAALAAALASAAEPPPDGRRLTASRAARSVTMQFGKVEDDIYILDYNPTFISGLQAFCIALTNFDCKLAF